MSLQAHSFADPITAASPLRSAARWVLCTAGAAALHGAAAFVLLTHWHVEPAGSLNTPAIAVELAAVAAVTQPAASDQPPSEAAKSEEQTERENTQSAQSEPQRSDVHDEPAAETTSVNTVEPVVPPAPEPIVKSERAAVKISRLKPAPLPPRHAERVVKERPRPIHESEPRPARPPAAANARARAARAEAPVPGVAHDTLSIPNWKSQLIARLIRNKQYPAEARARGEHGTVQLAFSIDRRGGVHRQRIVQSSGSPALDQATLALVNRAAPFPPPPADMRGAEIPINVPIRYDIR